MLILKPKNYCIPRRHRLIGQTTKQPSSNFEPRKPWKYKQFSGLRPDPSCLSVKLGVLQIMVMEYVFSFFSIELNSSYNQWLWKMVLIIKGL